MTHMPALLGCARPGGDTHEELRRLKKADREKSLFLPGPLLNYSLLCVASILATI